MQPKQKHITTQVISIKISRFYVVWNPLVSSLQPSSRDILLCFLLVGYLLKAKKPLKIPILYKQNTNTQMNKKYNVN